jgi:hypothetical protein
MQMTYGSEQHQTYVKTSKKNIASISRSPHIEVRIDLSLTNAKT